MADGPVIIRRKRVFAAEGHHGGAWKVAYADFVTAMMAFFMLMWLLNATTEEQRKGLADFFDPSIPISAVSGGGTDLLQGDSVFSSDTLASDNHGGLGETMEFEGELFQALSLSLKEAVESETVRLTRSSEGIVIDLLDTSEEPVFPVGKAVTTRRLDEVISRVAPMLATSDRMIKIVGHTDALRFADGDYSNWELSADRANAARRLAIKKGVPERAFYEVAGQADRLPISDDVAAPQNRRISIILLNPESIPLNAH
ncbi:flagellar motor protein MotB [Parvularcula lutaonensis]|uniref:Flagellar motor protein MotB n=1 Tax=Parvularcula lutaonensis TaxID=491923 RepID=A0ABV7M840_9PROT|nr:flagellar motor protein MotB [Parvularcula lutaonensis]GGY43820.1 chemotaxis protein MotB [Parvularcula lutaonensis]